MGMARRESLMRRKSRVVKNDNHTVVTQDVNIVKTSEDLNS